MAESPNLLYQNVHMNSKFRENNYKLAAIIIIDIRPTDYQKCMYHIQRSKQCTIMYKAGHE